MKLIQTFNYRVLFKILFTIILYYFSQSLYAYDLLVDGIYYNKLTDGKSVEVTYKDEKYNTTSPGSYEGVVVIPATITVSGVEYTVTRIGAYALSRSNNLTSVTMPESVIEIGNNAFRGCSGLHSIILHEGITEIGEGSFRECVNIASIEIPSTCKIIGSSAFSGCTNLSHLNLGTSVEEIGSMAFLNCNLTSLTIPNSLESISGGFSGNPLKEIIISDGDNKLKLSKSVFPIKDLEYIYLGRDLTYTLMSDEEYAPFMNCKMLRKVIIGDKVTRLNKYLFKNCTLLDDVTFGKNYIYLNEDCFSGCTLLKSVNIPCGTMYGAFKGCTALESITTGDGFLGIGRYSFQKCPALKTVIIGSNMQRVDGQSFQWSNLETIYSYAEIPPIEQAGAADPFNNYTYKNATLYVPENSIELYKKANYWKKFYNILPIKDIIIDENSEDIPVASDGVVDIRCLRTIKTNEWSTLCLPFNMTEEQLKSAFGDDVELGEFVSYDVIYDDNNNITEIFINFDNVELSEGLYANYPYVIKVQKDITEFKLRSTIEPDEESAVVEFDNGLKGKQRHVFGTFRGTYHANTIIPSKSLFLNENLFWYSVGLTKMKALRAYFTFEDVITNVDNQYSTKMRFMEDDAPTYIDVVLDKNDSKTQFIYTINGQIIGKFQSIENLPKGIYVINGKKILIK